MRVYIPLTSAGLRELHAESRLAPAPIRAHAVTDQLRVLLPHADEEEREYAALMAAALESCQRSSEGGQDWRRVVVAADVDAANVRFEGSEPSSVQVTVEISLRQCASVHVDDDSAQADVTDVRTALAAAADGQPLGELLDRLEEHELLWFATQEIPDILN